MAMSLRNYEGFTVFSLLILIIRVLGQELGQVPLQTADAYESPTHRVAIIGAGAGGSSAAYHLAKFHKENPTLQSIEIDIFETNDYVGGRTTTVNALNDPRYPTEVGASIFVKVNHILYNLTQDFNLPTRDSASKSTGALYDIGIWDGSSFLFTTTNSADNGGWLGNLKGYWDIVRLLWRYGLSPIHTIQAKNKVISMFFSWYGNYFPIANLGNFASAVGLSDYTGITGDSALLKNGISDKYAREVVQSSTRVNYAQNLNTIHGLETMVCMSTNGAMAINGGNWQIFNEAVKRSSATLHLNTSVTDIFKTPDNTYQIQTFNTSASTNHDPTKQYNTVILAGPYQFSNITFTPPLPPSTTPEHIDYVTNHVTLFASPYRPSPKFFSLSSQNQVPESILTTLPDTSNAADAPTAPRGTEAVGPSTFWSLSTLRVLSPATDAFPPSLPADSLIAASHLPHNLASANPNTTLYLYKIFSPAPITASFLSSLFAFNHTTSTNSSDPITALPTSAIPWSHTKIWHSYPYLPPKISFGAIMLDSPFEGHAAWFNAQTRAVWSPKNAHGVFYTSGVESFISTMETSALMGRNVAGIVVGGLMGEVEGRDRL